MDERATTSRVLEVRTVKVLLFGPQAQLLGQRAVEVAVWPGVTTCGEVLATLGALCPGLADSLPASRLAVDHEVAAADRVLRGDEELALIGLVGGG